MTECVHMEKSTVSGVRFGDFKGIFNKIKKIQIFFKKSIDKV